ncbi:RNA-binding S4 domain-containing protein [Pigmentiphaga sp.]|uniref:RNA-binding S4 domain-containing protein n=1 Tax=Pigmentiphaga sp. TaxID=1977564 RepID=UPI00128C73EA|nr:RNA-binding S4 domain-containing protein [Pigmentiphaga sp.]MPS29845.1 RNA-binding S4 domain-containing protein [Alcaligenaceae bacterium SAGV5]MPS50396.1 RNA-binding S4 domain-containing protein [Alcaligenaceae bacterium SAGV3]MPT57502.1 RNA-binding S4 domain-containing protein [Alcaligenaceae bacterium]
MEELRIDKWLWAARFYKTRTLAQDAVEAGQVKVAGERVKPSRAVRPGDILQIRAGEQDWEILVRALSTQRGPAVFARTLYDETPQGLKRRLEAIELRRQNTDPAANLKGRPTKQDRRNIEKWLP